MKDAMWKVTQDGSFVVYKAATPDQMVLIEPEPDLSLLKTALLSSFRGQCVGHQVLSTWLLDTNWRIPHLNSVLRELRNGKIVNVDGYTGTWGPTKGMYTFPPAGG